MHKLKVKDLLPSSSAAVPQVEWTEESEQKDKQNIQLLEMEKQVEKLQVHTHNYKLSVSILQHSII